MTSETLALAVIVGSTREGRRGRVVADWFAAEARQRPEFEVDFIDLAEVRLPAVLSMRADAAVAAYQLRLARADAFVIVTPEYNHSFPASLKTAIDVAHEEWRRKPVGFVSYGGLAGGLRAVEHLRPVFVELHATTVRDTVSFHGPWNPFGPDGQPTRPGRCACGGDGDARRPGLVGGDAGGRQRSLEAAQW